MKISKIVLTKPILLAVFLLAYIGVIAAGLSVGNNRQQDAVPSGRRQFLSMTAAIAFSARFPKAKYAAAKDNLQSTQQEELVFVGCGCFWHLQHICALFEREMLGRTGNTLTCQAGYAGGKPSSRLCYHNTEHIQDYADMGHTEVVQVSLPTSGVVDFVDQLYFSQAFDPITKDRRDPMDKGPEYRNAIGLVGGMYHPLYPQIAKVAKQNGYRLTRGRGCDPDTLGRREVYVYDSSIFSFHQAEIYHQFHNDFQSLAYGPKYNNLANRALADGRLHRIDCPDRITEFVPAPPP